MSIINLNIILIMALIFMLGNICGYVRGLNAGEGICNQLIDGIYENKFTEETEDETKRIGDLDDDFDGTF